MGERKLNIKLPAKLPFLFMSYNVPSLNTAVDKQDVYTLEVISHILSGGKSARLPKILERQRELVTSVGSSYDSFNLYNSLFTLTAIPAKSKTVTQVEKALKSQLEQIKTTPVDLKELDRIKASLIANKTYEQDSIYYQAMLIGILESINLSWQEYNKYIDKLKKVTPEEIQATAKKYFNNDRLTIAVLEPEDIN